MSTPGPWHTEIEYVSAQRKAKTGYTNIRNHADVFVCKVFGEEDSRLIAAAPEILKACQQLLCLEAPTSDVNYKAAWQKIQSAIEKAEGKQ